MSWPKDDGPWVIAATSAAAGWDVAAAALAAASGMRVAVLRIVHRGRAEGPGIGLLRRTVATLVEVQAGAATPLDIDDVVRLTNALAHHHDLVLVGALDGLLVPLGRGGWTLADLAGALPAPVVVVAATGPESVNHTALALDALIGRDITAAVVAVGDDDDGNDDSGDDAVDLPVAWAGRIPAGAVERPDEFAAEAPGWLDPMLHGTRGQPAAVEQPAAEGAVVAPPDDTPPAAAPDNLPPRSTIIGRRVATGILVALVLSLLVLCGINATGPTDVIVEQRQITVESRSAFLEPGVRTSRRVEMAPRPKAATVCPQYAGSAVPTQPDPAGADRVNAAWARIERWLAAHAPPSGASLRPPAAPERIVAVQMRMSVHFPPDLVASLRRHDGVAPGGHFTLPSFFRPMGVDEILRDWEGTCEFLAIGIVNDRSWHRAFVPFAEASDGGALLVDQSPGGRGRVGEYFPGNGTTFDFWPASVADLLDGVAQALETGRPYAGRHRPVITAGGRLEWDLAQPPEPPR